VVEIEWSRFDAVLFDLDGVLTDTARVHAAAWKRTFDEYLTRRAEARGEPFVPFDIDADYHRHVDGKPRYDGVRDFLRSRGIDLPEGPPEASPDEESVRGVGNRKNELVSETIRRQGIDVFPGSVQLVRELRAAGLRTAVVTSSSNCDAVLEAAEIADLFDAKVDGRTAVARGLPGKPAPDAFLAAAADLAVDPSRAVVVEDAISGVQAGRAGAFGCVLGVARKDNAADLRENGADLVVSDLGELVARRQPANRPV